MCLPLDQTSLLLVPQVPCDRGAMIINQVQSQSYVDIFAHEGLIIHHFAVGKRHDVAFVVDHLRGFEEAVFRGGRVTLLRLARLRPQKCCAYQRN